MAIDIEGLLASVDLVAVVESRVDLVKNGSDWFGLCPFHGESTPSFTVNPGKGFFHCFGCGIHGDALDFLRQLDGLTLPEAAEALGSPAIKALPRTADTRAALEWQSSIPEKPLTNMWLRGLGEPVKRWAYKSRDGVILGWVGRYMVDGKKEPRCWTWGAFGDEAPRWAPHHFSKPRPLLGLDELQARPNDQVVVVEGEPTWDAAKVLFPRSVAITWPGGVDGIRHADWSGLRGRRVVCIPDADRHVAKTAVEAKRFGVAIGEVIPYESQPGPAAMAWLHQHLHQFGEVIVRLVDVGIVPERKSGWDLADALADGWTTSQAVQWAREHIVREDPTPIPEVKRPRGRPPLYVVEGANVLAVQQEEFRLAAAALSELALADKFVEVHADTWRYIKARDEWVGWGDDGWRVDELGRPKLAASEIARGASENGIGEKASASTRRKVCSAGTANAILSLAGVNEKIASSPDQWNTNPMLLGVPGGVIDLRDGSSRPARPDDHISMRCAVAPEPGVPKLWLGHLRRVLKDDTELIGFLQRFFGYMLTGEVGEHALVFLYGKGGNGKGTVVETVIKLMGDYGYAAPVNLLMESKTERHPVELAMLRSRRGVSCSEPAQGARWDDGRVKWLTGGDTITARSMGENLRSFAPTHKLLVMGNHKPSLRSVDDAIRRRFCIVDFGLKIPREEMDTRFPEKLREEWPQILSWMIEGSMLWQEGGLGRPDSLVKATESYLQDEDTINQWIEEQCEREGLATVAELYRNYTAWCETAGERVWSKRAFSSALYGMPGIGRKATSQARMVDGLRLRIGA